MASLYLLFISLNNSNFPVFPQMLRLFKKKFKTQTTVPPIICYWSLFFLVTLSVSGCGEEWFHILKAHASYELNVYKLCNSVVWCLARFSEEVLKLPTDSVLLSMCVTFSILTLLKHFFKKDYCWIEVELLWHICLMLCMHLYALFRQFPDTPAKTLFHLRNKMHKKHNFLVTVDQANGPLFRRTWTE